MYRNEHVTINGFNICLNGYFFHISSVLKSIFQMDNITNLLERITKKCNCIHIYLFTIAYQPYTNDRVRVNLLSMYNICEAFKKSTNVNYL